MSVLEGGQGPPSFLPHALHLSTQMANENDDWQIIAQDTNKAIRHLFAPLHEIPSGSPVNYPTVVEFERLIEIFIAVSYGSDPDDPGFAERLAASITVDIVAFASAWYRFQRDSFGMARITKFLDASEAKNEISAVFKASLLDHIHKLGLRVDSKVPFRTRIAACFCLWFCTYRPIRIDPTGLYREHSPGNRTYLESSELEQFNAAAIFWMATTYLSCFGTINYGSGADAEERKERIRYDLTVRDLNLSSLEFMLAGIFRRNEIPPKSNPA